MSVSWSSDYEPEYVADYYEREVSPSECGEYHYQSVCPQWEAFVENAKKVNSEPVAEEEPVSEPEAVSSLYTIAYHPTMETECEMIMAAALLCIIIERLCRSSSKLRPLGMYEFIERADNGIRTLKRLHGRHRRRRPRSTAQLKLI